MASCTRDTKEIIKVTNGNCKYFPKKEDLIAPEWVLNKTVVLNDIDKLMIKNDTYQGKKIQL